MRKAVNSTVRSRERKFFDALRDIFVGAKVEGESGYINLMKIKSRYYEKGVFPRLKQDIEFALKSFCEFRKELFEKLYTFFQRYFSESGSIYFRYTPIHQNVYEKVYTDDKDVILFWKTHMLYYVKTDRLFKNLEVEIDGHKFFFDVSTLEHKRANEKREIIFEFKEKRKDGVPVFSVSYSERGKITKIEDILKSLKKEDIEITEDTLERAFRVFEKQSEVDYFINKNAKEFLREQFNIRLYQYVFSGESVWTEKRIKQLQVLKDIAFKIIDFISQFEDELVKIWNKPKFVLNSNYVITLDRIAEKDKGLNLIEKILEHKNFEEQIKEWKDLGIVDVVFNKNKIVENDLTGKHLSKDYKYLPIDTKYFKDLELEILGLFDDLDNSLDGWLIKSENYQALNTILSKFKEKVQTIYIDPPFKTGKDFFYKDKFQDSSWITLMENRLDLAKSFLDPKGTIFIHLDWNANYLGRHLLEKLFPNLTEIVWNTNATKDEEAGLFSYKSFGEKFVRQHDTIFQASKTDDFKFIKLWKPNRRTTNLEIGWLDLISYPNKPNPQKINDYDFFIEKYDEEGILNLEKQEVEEKIFPLGDIWNDIYSFTQSELRTSENVSYDTQKPENLLRRIIQSTSEKGDIIMDFFAGSGTTITVSHKLKRKWIGVEVADCFNEFYFDDNEQKLGLLGRMKIVLRGDKEFIAVDKKRRSHLSKQINWQGGGFFKYYELEQYEDTLRKVKYEDADLFDNPYQDPYNQYVFMRDLKLLSALEIDYKNNKVKVNLSKLYSNIDIPETLSNLLGKWIKKITSEYVEFEDGERIDLRNLDYKVIKPLIWW
ncbi:MAG: site-specific DNA-methyltransferase [Spirochaetes bacterium]|nr:MAG: site-specific DNA-methyltransferase [Spirochaetota bacterium]